jgi:hypothetical protein
MNKLPTNTHASKETVNFQPGSTLESVGVFFMEKINIYKPTKLPVAECDYQIEDYQIRQEYEDYRCQRGEITDAQRDFLKDEHKMKVIYFKRCKELAKKP